MFGVSPMRKFLVVAGLFAALLPSAHAVDYYIDSTSTGTNQGTYENPWKSLAWNAPVNTRLFQPGDRILFRKGRTYNGTLFFGGGGNGGTAGLPLVIDSYEVPGDPNVKPIIAGGGVAGATIELKNKAYTTVQNLEITNWPADPTVEGSSPGVRMGIRVTAYSQGTWSGIKILNNTVRKIRGITARSGLYGNAAIQAVIADSSVNARWNDFLIEENDLSDNTCIGIHFKSPPYYTMTNTAQWSSNVKIRGNTFRNVGADHILLNGCESPVVEYNKGYDAGLYGTRGYEMIAGMWTCYKTQNTLFQYNEVAYTVNEFQNGISGDSKAFDVDYGTQGNHIFQYNYTHHNEGGVLIVMPREDNPTAVDFVKTTIYRYNLSVNDGRNTGSCSQFGIWPVQGTSSAHIYNNVFYSTLPEGYKFSDVTAAYYTNNIFYVPAAIYPSGPRFSNNAYYGHVPSVNDPYKVLADPKFVSPFPQGAGEDGDITANTDIFKIQANSPLINAGKTITQAPLPTMDYWFNPLTVGRVDIGAHEHQSPTVGTTLAPTAAATTVYEDPLNSPTVTYGGTWGRVTNDGKFSGNNQSTASSNGAWVQVTFTGTNLSLYGKRAADLGTMNVTIDGNPNIVGVADSYWPITQYRTELYRVTGLTNAQHTVRFTLAGKSSFSTNTYVGIDYFEILPVTPPELPVVTVIDNAAGTHVGTWDTTGTSAQSVQYYGLTRSISTTVGNYVDYTFTGTGVRIYGPKASDRGKFTVSVDGGTPVLIDQFSPVTFLEHIDHRMKLFEVNGLPNTTHTVRLTVAESGGKQVVIDWLEGLVGGYVPPAPVIVDTNGSTPSLAYAGTWTHAADALFHNATKSVANSNNASVQLTFTGTKASLYVKTAPGLGKLNISVNNGPPALVDCNTTGTAYKVKIFETAVLSPGTHTIKATVYDPGLTNKYVGVDYFEYQP